MDGEGQEYKKQLKKFEKLLLDAINAVGGIKKDIELEFTFGRQNSINIVLMGKHFGVMDDKNIREKLSSVYIGENSVSPEVREIMVQRYQS